MSAPRLDLEAVEELREAATWYKERSPEVARRFLRETRILLREVAQAPERFPVLIEPEVTPPVRRALVPGFPYAILFLVRDGGVHVLAVAHQHRAPGYWLRRIRRAR